MDDIQIYIGDIKLDLYPDTAIPLSYEIARFQQLDFRSNGSSKTITIPATDNNRIAFDFAEDVNSLNKYDQTKKTTGRIIQEGAVTMIGFVKILNPKIDSENKVISYTFNIQSDNGDWRSRLKGANLQDLDYTDQEHTYNEATQLASETITTGVEYLYPIINYGKMSGRWGFKRDIKVRDRYTSWNIKGIVDRIYKEAGGYKVESNFFDNFGEGLYLPFTNKTFKHPQSFRDDNLFRAGTTRDGTIIDVQKIDSFYDTDSDTANGEFDNGGNYFIFGALGQYLIPNSGFYVFTATLNIRSRFDLLPPNIQSAFTGDGLNGVILKINIYRGNGIIKTEQVRIEDFDNYIPIKVVTDREVFTAGEAVYVEIVNTITVTRLGVSYLCPYEFNTTGNLFYNDILLDVEDGAVITNELIQENLPNKLQIDFIKGLRDTFNLMFLTNAQTRTVYIDPYDEFYNGEVIDISDKIDYSKGIQIGYLGANLSKKIRYKYITDDNDAIVKELTEKQESPYGSELIELDNQFSRDETRDKNNEFFAVTYMDTASELGFNNTYIPKLWANEESSGSDSVNTTDFIPRILYYNGVQSMLEGNSYLYEGNEYTNFPQIYSRDISIVNGNSLYYNSDERNDGLQSKYYRNYHETLNKSNTLTLYLNLTASDLESLQLPQDTPTGFDFRQNYLINSSREDINGVYRLVKVFDYNAKKRGTTKVELLKVVRDIPAAEKTVTVLTEPDEIFPLDFGNDTIGNGNKDSLGLDDDGGVFFIGDDLIGGDEGSDQVIIGEGNEKSTDDKVIIGKRRGGDGKRENPVSVDKDGNARVAGGGIVATINGITVPVYYTYTESSKAVATPRQEIVVMENNPTG